jgi:hypothetical protein
MSTDLDEAERGYKVVDALYRLHRDLFAVESAIATATHTHAKLARSAAAGQMGALVAGMLVLVPILIALGDVKWNSAPAIVIYVVTFGVVALSLWQVRSAGQLEGQLASIERDVAAEVLEQREDFLLEEVNASVIRHRMLEPIVVGLEAQVAATADAARVKLQAQIARYQEIMASEFEYVKHLARTSADMVKLGRRTREQHEVLLDWCRGIPDFDSAQFQA